MQAFERDQAGQRQAIADLISNLEPLACPCTSMVKKIQKPNKKVLEHQAEVYGDVGHGGVLDGKDVDSDEFTHTPRHLLHSVSQKVWYNPQVSDFAEETVVAGIPGRGEMSRQKAIALIQIKRIIERRFLSNSECSIDDGVSVKNSTRGLGVWIQNSEQSVYAVPAAVRTPAASIYSSTLSAFTEDALGDIMESIYTQRKDTSVMKFFVGVKLKRHVSTFTSWTPDVASNTITRTFNQDATSKTITNVVDRLVLDTGTVDLMLSSFLYTNATTGAATANTTRSGFLCDMNKLAMAYTRLPRTKDLEDRGGGPRAIVDAIFMCMCENPLGQGKVEISS
jgi:hypothetical protein